MKTRPTTDKYRGKLHVYAQYSGHDDAVIVGDKVALSALRDAINQAIESNEGIVGSFTQDGEGYATIVRCRPEDSDYWDRVGLPYTADFHGCDGGALDPRDPEADE